MRAEQAIKSVRLIKSHLQNLWFCKSTEWQAAPDWSGLWRNLPTINKLRNPARVCGCRVQTERRVLQLPLKVVFGTDGEMGAQAHNLGFEIIFMVCPPEFY
jgi:hypothetical protein